MVNSPKNYSPQIQLKLNVFAALSFSHIWLYFHLKPARRQTPPPDTTLVGPESPFGKVSPD